MEGQVSPKFGEGYRAPPKATTGSAYTQYEAMNITVYIYVVHMHELLRLYFPISATSERFFATLTNLCFTMTGKGFIDIEFVATNKRT